MQIDAAILETRCFKLARLHQLTGCTEIIVKSVNMYRFQKDFHIRPPLVIHQKNVME